MKFKKSKKIACLTLAAVMATATLAASTACSESDELVVWTFTDELTSMVEGYYKKDNPSANVKVVEYSLSMLTSKLSQALMTGKNLPDVVALEAKVLLDILEFDAFEDLSSTIADGSADNMYEYTKEVVTQGSAVYGLAWQATPGGFVYRSDLAERYLGITSPDEMAAKIATWDGFIEMCGELYDESGGEVKALSSITEPVKVYLSQRTNAWVKDEKLVVDDKMTDGGTEDGVDGCMEMMKILQAEGYSNESTERDSTWYSDMDNGKVLGYFMTGWGMYYDLQSHASSSSGKWAMCRAAKDYFYGGTWLSVLKASDKKDEAKDLVKYFTTNEDFLTSWSQTTGDFINNRSLMGSLKATYEGCSFLGGQNHFDLLYNIADNIDGKLMTRYDNYIESSYMSHAGNYAMEKTGYSTISATLQNLRNSIKTKYPSLNVDA